MSNASEMLQHGPSPIMTSLLCPQASCGVRIWTKFNFLGWHGLRLMQVYKARLDGTIFRI